MIHSHAATVAPPPKNQIILRFGKPILFLIVSLCLAGSYAGLTMPSSVFPQTDFPRVVILIDNGVMPGDEMMATVTRPVEESMKDIPGTISIRSTTGRGSAAVNVFFDWSTDMTEAEQYVLARLAQIQATLPPTATMQVQRLTFSAFPILGISLTSDTRPPTELWETARYDIYPRFLRIRGVARIKLVGGRVPEYHVIVDPTRLEANQLTFAQVTQSLADTNLFTSSIIATTFCARLKLPGSCFAPRTLRCIGRSYLCRRRQFRNIRGNDYPRRQSLRNRSHTRYRKRGSGSNFEGAQPRRHRLNRRRLRAT